MIQNFVAFQFIQPNETNKQTTTTTTKQKSKEEKKKRRSSDGVYVPRMPGES